MLSKKMRDLWAEKGFGEPTEIQSKAWPLISGGKSVLITAPTGFGKTEAALLPIFDALMTLPKEELSKPGIRVLYVTPLRALNRDMLSRMKWWSQKLGLSFGVRHGDTPQSERAKQLSNPPHFLLTTPETLQALLAAPKMSMHLSSTRAVIIDEIHELYSDKRGSQLSVALERLEKKTGKPLMRIGLSATVADPVAVGKFLAGWGRLFDVASLDIARKIHLRVHAPSASSADKETAEKIFLEPEACARLRVLSELMEKRKTLVFTNTRSIAETLSSRLLGLNASVAVHHGSLSYSTRVSAEERFKSGEVHGLISTSSLELGLDIGDVEQVIQYLSPRQASRLLQRVGRSGHSVHKIPRGEVLAGDGDDVLECIAVMRMALDHRLEPMVMPLKPLDVVAHQLAGLALEYGNLSIEDALAVFKRAHSFSTLSPEDISDVARQLSQSRLIRFDGKNVFRSAFTRDYYYSNLSTIPSERKFFVRNSASNSVISTLDEGFVSSLEKGVLFISKGLPWRVLDIQEDEIIVEPAQSFDAAIPDWEGEEIPVPFEVAQEVGRLRKMVLEQGAESKLAVPVSAVSKARLVLSACPVLPDEKTIFVECNGDVAVIHACIGRLANESLARALSHLLSLRFGSSVRHQTDPYRIVLHLPQPMAAQALSRLLLEIGDLDKLLRKALFDQSIYRFKFTHVARAFGVIGRDGTLNPRLIRALANTPIARQALEDVLRDYVSIGEANNVLSRLRNGEWKVVSKDVKSFSGLAQAAFSRSRAGELIAPIEPASEILKAFKKGILEENTRLLCTYCTKVFYSKVKDLSKRVECPHCGARLVTPAMREQDEFVKNKGKGNAENRKKYLDLLRHASLVEAYGQRAVAALSVYGVGASTAARVLAHLNPDEDLFYCELMEAQKQFIRTKGYWKA